MANKLFQRTPCGAAEPTRYGYMMKRLAAFMIYSFVTAVSAEAFEGAALNEKEIRNLFDSKCKQFLVYSTSAKSAMPAKLEQILSQGDKFITAKVLSCNLKGTEFEFYLEKREGVWVMFDAESITISSKGPR